MHTRRLLKTRAGFTLVELLIALTLTAIIGTAVTGVFITQSRFFDHQEKTSFARGVSRSAMNIIISEMRMLERGTGVVSASSRQITINAPYAIAMSCGTGGGGLIVSQIPADTFMSREAGYSGYAYRTGAGAYTYVPGNIKPTGGQASTCTTARVRVLPTDSGGRVLRLQPQTNLPPGTPVLMYQQVTYEFKNSVQVPGRVALWRSFDAVPLDEELVAPFDTTASFRFYVNDSPLPQTAVPGALGSITGIQLILDGLSERPMAGGQRQRVAMKTSVFFKNR
jgi:prepilin-type N-terminal cleavage/methylation domain-containing protein